MGKELAKQHQKNIKVLNIWTTGDQDAIIVLFSTISSFSLNAQIHIRDNAMLVNEVLVKLKVIYFKVEISYQYYLINLRVDIFPSPDPRNFFIWWDHYDEKDLGQAIIAF